MTALPTFAPVSSIDFFELSGLSHAEKERTVIAAIPVKRCRKEFFIGHAVLKLTLIIGDIHTITLHYAYGSLKHFQQSKLPYE